MMKHTLLYIAVSGMTLLTSCNGGKSIRTQPCKA